MFSAFPDPLPPRLYLSAELQKAVKGILKDQKGGANAVSPFLFFSPLPLSSHFSFLSCFSVAAVASAGHSGGTDQSSQEQD
jgi:hypothetical protein